MIRLADAPGIPEPRMHDGKLALGNINDVHAWVAQLVNRKFAFHVNGDHDRDEEIVAAGVALMFEVYRGKPVRNKAGDVVGFEGGWNPDRTPDFAAHCFHELPRRLIDWWRREMRQSGIMYRSGHAGGYVQLHRTSYELLTDERSEKGMVQAPPYYEPGYEDAIR